MQVFRKLQFHTSLIFEIQVWNFKFEKIETVESITVIKI